MSTNWRGMQAYGCKQPDFVAPGETNVSHMAGGCWRANLMKDGALYVKSKGGTPKPKKKSKNKYNIIPPTVPTDKKGYSIL